MCLVLGDILPRLANLRHDSLSSKTTDCGIGWKALESVDVCRLHALDENTCCWNSLIVSHKGISSRMDCDRAMYSASMVLRATCDWSLDAQCNGQFL